MNKALVNFRDKLSIFSATICETVSQRKESPLLCEPESSDTVHNKQQLHELNLFDTQRKNT